MPKTPEQEAAYVAGRQDAQALLDLLYAGRSGRAPDVLGHHHKCYPLSEWHEDDGFVVWWKFPVEEPAWIGTPNDDDWPGYHTHWTAHPPIPTPTI